MSPDVALPEPRTASGLGSLLAARRSTRDFPPDPLSLETLGQLLWSGYGIRPGGRTVPSAHALYPLDLTVVAGPLRSAAADPWLDPAVWGYDPIEHALRHLCTGDHRISVASAAFADADWLVRAPVLLALSADLERLNHHFADQPQPATRGTRYAWMESGHISQNLYLHAAESGLGAVLVAGIDDEVAGPALASLTGRTRLDPLGIIALGTTLVARRGDWNERCN